jgi:transposase
MSVEDKPNLTLSEAVKNYQDLGFAILPAIYGEKRPAIEWKKYQQKAPTKKEIKEFFKSDKQQNIAILCGVPSANLVVLDFDDISIYPKFFDTQALQQETLVARTGSGKFHVYLRSDKSVNSFKIPQLKLEVRSDGNIVIAPPSKHPSGGFYEFVNQDVEKVMVVADLVSAIWSKAEKLGVKTPTDLLTEDLHERGEQPYEGPDPPCIVALSKGVGEGIRNEAGMRLLSYWLKFKRDIDSAKVLRRLKKWNRLNKPPLPKAELKTLMESAQKLDRSYGCRVNQAWCNLDQCSLLRNKLLRKEAEEEAEKILSSLNVLGALKPYLDNIVTGEDDNKKLEFILLLSGKVKDPRIKQIVLLKSEPGAGKSHLMKIADAFKTKSVGRFSPHALDYSNLADYEILRLKELGGMDQEFQGVSTIKFLSADDRGYNIEVTERDERGRFTTKQYRIPPITLITSTIRVQLDPQFERRAWIENPDETKEQTKRIAEWKAKLEREKNLVALGLMKETSYDHSIRVLRAVVKKLEAVNVILPFPHTLTEVLGAEKLRLRGDYDKFFGLVKLYGFLHQRTLPIIEGANEHKAVLVLPQHAFEALKIAEKPYVTMTTELEERSRKLISTLKELEVTKVGDAIDKDLRGDLAVRLGLSEKTVLNYLSEWRKAGYMGSTKTTGRGRPVEFKLLYNLDVIEKKAGATLDIAKMGKERCLDFQAETESFLDSLRKKISYGMGWTEQKIRNTLKLDVSIPWGNFFQKETEAEPSSIQETQETTFPISPISKVEGLNSEKKTFLETVNSVKPLNPVTEGKCWLCDNKRVLYWQLQNPQEEWVDVCQDCGMEVQKTIRQEGDVFVQKR